jgi:hypothetical protein
MDGNTDSIHCNLVSKDLTKLYLQVLPMKNKQESNGDDKRDIDLVVELKQYDIH